MGKDQREIRQKWSGKIRDEKIRRRRKDKKTAKYQIKGRGKRPRYKTKSEGKKEEKRSKDPPLRNFPFTPPPATLTKGEIQYPPKTPRQLAALQILLALPVVDSYERGALVVADTAKIVHIR